MVDRKLKLAIPKGRLFQEVATLLLDAGFRLCPDERSYRPWISDTEIEVKLLKPQSIPQLVEQGSQDIGFAGLDWVIEQRSRVKELLDTGFNPVRIVAAVPSGFDPKSMKEIRIASEYENISREFMEAQELEFIFIRSYGGTEAFVPEDADMIIDNTSTGKTLESNNLQIYSEILCSSTRLIANEDSLADTWKSKKIGAILLIMKSVLLARKKVFIEMNIPGNKMDSLVRNLPCMKSPSISKLYGNGDYAVKIAVDRCILNTLVPYLKEQGASDILVFNPEKVVP